MKYSDFVDYSKLDPFKEKVIKYLTPTFKNLSPLHIRVVNQSIGEPAVLLDFLDYDFYLAFKSDGVGTKNKIADTMLKAKSYKLKAKKLYSGFGIDLIAMNANDLICLGAAPIALSDEVASGDSSWFNKKEEVEGLIWGLKKGCDQAGITIPCGETPTLPDIIYKDSVNITGSMIGIVRPKTKVIFGQNLKAGDLIYGLASSGIHSNGLTLARKIVEKLPKSYFTHVPFGIGQAPFSSKTIGEALLIPTSIYVKPILEMINIGLDIHYITNITGSAFKKIMRAKKPFTYFIDNLPQKPPIFNFLQQAGKISDKEAYQTWNMGIGMVILAPAKEENKMKLICKKHKVGFFKLGVVKQGQKQVIIKPLKISYQKGE